MIDERAVSEVIAFILVFSIVITSVGLLYTVGFGAINDIQRAEQDRSAERAFGAVAVAFEDIQTDRATTRQARMELSGRSISINESEQLRVELEENGDTALANGTLVYGAFEDTEIVYQSGAVIRWQGSSGQATSRAPRFRCTDEHALVSLVDIEDGYGDGAFTSDDSVSIQASRTNFDESRIAARYEADGGSPTNVTVTYEGTRYQRAWEHYFASDDNRWIVDGDEYVCEDVERAYVTKTEMEVDFVNA